MHHELAMLHNAIGPFLTIGHREYDVNVCISYMNAGPRSERLAVKDLHLKHFITSILYLLTNFAAKDVVLLSNYLSDSTMS